MGGMLASCACSAATCCATQLCSSVCSACGEASKKGTLFGRLLYAVILLLMSLFAFLLKNLPVWLDQTQYLNWIPGFHGCVPKNVTSTDWLNIIKDHFPTQSLDIRVPQQLCYGTMSVYRVSFSLAIFHLIFSLVMIRVQSTSDVRHKIQHSWWIVKVPALILLIVGSFFIPNDVFVPYGWIALVGSGFFVFIQLLLLVDFAHSWTEKWVSYYEETKSRWWAAALIVSSAILYLFSIALSVVMYIYFTENPRECWFNPMFITVNLMLCFTLTVFSIHPKVQEKNSRIGLLQAAVITAYSTYLIWSSLSSEPSSKGCSKLPSFFSANTTGTDAGSSGGAAGSGTSLFLGVFFTFLALIYSALKISSEHDTLRGKNPEDKASKKSLLSVTEMGSEKTDEDEKEADDEVEPPETESEEEDDKPAYNYSFFHFTFLLASMYLGMVLTNWQSVTAVTGDDVGNTILVDQGMVAAWIKVVASWITLLLYLWTVVAPMIFPNRTFWYE